MTEDNQTPPATQPSATVGDAGRVLAKIMNRHASNVMFHDNALAEEAWAALATMHTPPPVATATVVDAGAAMTANKLKAVIRAWLDGDDATHWGAFETALDAAVSGTPERAAVVAMLRADAATMRANAHAYSEEAPTDAKALHEVAATLAFKAAQIERGDHLAATTTPPAGDQ